MSELQSAVDYLDNLMAPVTEYTNGPKVWMPVTCDPQERLKCDVIGKAERVLAAGKAALGGNVPASLPIFGRNEIDAIERSLATDPEFPSYLELAGASERVLLAVAKLAA